MRTAVAIAIMVLVGVLAALMLYILARRLVVAWVQGIQRRRRETLEHALQPWLRGETATPPPLLQRLRRWPDRGIFVDLCLQELPRSDAATRARMIEWLEAHGYVEQWLRDLRHRSAWKRENAAELLGIARPERAVDPLLEALQDEMLDVRMRAAAALGQLGGRRAREALIGALTDQNRWSTIRITDLLSGMGPEVGAELRRAFPGMGRAARLAAIDLIARVGSADSGEFFTGLLQDEDIDIRARAAAALGRIAHHPAAGHLLQALEDPAWPVRAMAAKALGSLQVEAAVPLLCDALRDHEWWVRANSAAALRALGPAGADALRRMQHDPDRFARDQARATLDEMEAAS
jgi:hypothetical protein